MNPFLFSFFDQSAPNHIYAIYVNFYLNPLLKYWISQIMQNQKSKKAILTITTFHLENKKAS